MSLLESEKAQTILHNSPYSGAAIIRVRYTIQNIVVFQYVVKGIITVALSTYVLERLELAFQIVQK